MTEEQKIKKVNIGKEITEWIFYFIGVVIVTSILQSQLFALTTVHQSSMQDTLQEGHTLIINKVIYQFSKPNRGDIIVFLREENTKGFINRYKVSSRMLSLSSEKVSGQTGLLKG